MRLVRASLVAVLLITLTCSLRADETLPPAAAPPEAAPATEAAASTEPAAEEGITAEQFEASLSYEHGVISVKDGLASLTLPEGYRFLGARDSKRLLEDAWGNPPGAADGVLGMIVPSGVSPLAEEGWAVVITHDEDGYVEDKDAAEIDYTKLLTQMQEAVVKTNEERAKNGFTPIQLVGWAEPPTYDPATHKMYWAKELHFEGHEVNTLNYNVRVLGRRGVLNLNAVGTMNQLPSIHRDMGEVLGFVEFNEGHRYADFIKGTDKKAAYGIAGLVAGAVAMKAGLFKGLFVALLAAKKLVIAGAIGLLALLKKVFSGKGTQGPPPT